MPFELFISFRYLKAKQKYGFISFNTIVSITGVALGVMALIVVLAVMSGFERDMKSKIIGVYSELTVSARGRISDYRDVIEKVKKVPHVLAATPSILGQVIVRAPRRARGVVLRGIDPVGEAEATDLDTHIVHGTLLSSGPGIIVGEEFARELGIVVGDSVKIVSPVEVDTPAGPVPVVIERRVEGIFNSGMFEYDSSLVYVDLETAQKLFRFGDAAHEINVHIEDVDLTERVRGELNELLPLRYKVSSWIEKNPSLFAAVRMEKKMMFFIVGLIVLVAALNIASTLIMVVIEKTKDIGILKAIGVRQRSIRRIFTVEGAIIGSTGSMIGLIAGILFSLYINPIADFIGWATGFDLFRSDIYYLDRIPVELSWTRIAVTAVIAIALSIAAALYPAWHAARVNPVEALRYE